jgi:myo-inositol-1(or 4)-monophosphatase
VPTFAENAAQIAREAGALIEEIRRGRESQHSKAFDLKGEFDLVTEADRASEALIVRRLAELYPDHSVVAEEGGGQATSSEFRWYVDPVDGTTNFAHGFPVYNVTLALERGDELIAGVVFDPTRGEMFSAERGGGAYLNGQRLRVSPVDRLEETLVATGFPSRRRHLNVNVHFYYQLSMLSHGVRRAGAAAIDLAYVAAGRLDVFWEFGLNPWDMAAGVLLIEEAGGRVSDMHGNRHRLNSPHSLATNGRVHEAILGVFSGVFQGKWEFTLPEISARQDPA